MKKQLLSLFASLLCLLAINASAQNHYYVTPSAKGEGTSWTDTANLTAVLDIIVERLANKPNENFNIYLSEGRHIIHKQYDLANINIYGGFIADESLEDRSDKTRSTIAYEGQNDIHLFHCDGDQVVFDGIIFTEIKTAEYIIKTRGHTVIKNCEFTGNSQGAVLIDNTEGEYHASFINTKFYKNGLIESSNNTVKIVESGVDFLNCEFRGNVSQSSGGAIEINATKAYPTHFINCLFSGNRSGNVGSALFYKYFNSEKTHIYIDNCTFALNASEKGGVIFIDEEDVDAVAHINSSIFWNNTGTADERLLISKYDPSISEITNSIIPSEELVKNLISEKNIEDKEIFIIPLSPDSAPTIEGDFNLTAESKATNAGNTERYLELVLDFPNLRFRSHGTQVDIGAFEYKSTPGNCLSIDNKFLALQNGKLLSGGAFTFETWTKAIDGDKLFFIENGNQNGFYIDYSEVSRPSIYFYGSIVTLDQKQIPTKEWFHFALTYQNEIALIYVNGNLIAEIDQSAYLSYPFRLFDFGATTEKFECTASYDETRIWNRVLKQEEIQANIHNSFETYPEELAHYFKFDKYATSYIAYDEITGSNMPFWNGFNPGPAPYYATSLGVTVPINISTTNINPMSTTIHWDAVANAEGYMLYVIDEANSTYGEIFELGPTATSKLIQNFEPSTEYTASILAIVDKRESALSSIHHFKTEAPYANLIVPASVDFGCISQESALGDDGIQEFKLINNGYETINGTISVSNPDKFDLSNNAFSINRGANTAISLKIVDPVAETLSETITIMSDALTKDLQDDLFSYWSFDNTLESYDNTNSINIGNSTIAYEAGRRNQAMLKVDETAFDIESPVEFDNNGFAVNLWMKTDVEQGALITLETDPKLFNIEYDATHVSVNLSDVFIKEAFEIYDNQWHMITVIAEATLMTLYIDGEFKQSKEINLSEASNGISWVVGNKYHGYIDELRFYNNNLETLKEKINMLYGKQTFTIEADIQENLINEAFAVNFCQGETFTLDATLEGAESYSWAKIDEETTLPVPIADETTATYDITEEGQYIATVTKCNQTKLYNFNALFLPSPSINNFVDDEVCLNEKLIFTGATIENHDDYVIDLNGNDGEFGIEDGNYFFIPKDAPTGIIDLKIIANQNAGGCSSAEETISITVNPVPEVILSNIPEVCLGQTIPLDPENEWFINGEPYTEETYTFTSPEDISLKIIVSNQYGCKASDETTVMPNALPSIQITESPEYLFEGGSGFISIDTDADKIEWYVNGGKDVIQETDSYEFIAPSVGTHEIKALVTDHNGCQSYETATITVIEDFYVPVDTAFCSGGILELDLGLKDMNAQYFLNGNQTTNPIKIESANPYTIKVIQNGIPIEKEIQVIEYEPVYIENFKNKSFCVGQELSFNTIVDNAVNDDWTFIFQQSEFGNNGNTITLTESGEFDVHLLAKAAPSCPDIDSVATATVKALPVITHNLPISVCQNEDLIGTVDLIHPDDIVVWELPEEVISSNFKKNMKVPGVQDISISYTDQNQCLSIVLASVEIKEKMGFSIVPANAEVYVNKSTTVSLESSEIFTEFNYTGDLQNTIKEAADNAILYSPLEEGTHTITAIGTYENTCTDTATASIIAEYDPESMTFDLGEDKTVCPNTEVTLTAGINDVTSYEWNIEGENKNDQSITVTEPGTYSVTVTKNEKVIEDEITISNFTLSTITPTTLNSICQNNNYELAIEPNADITSIVWKLDGEEQANTNILADLAGAFTYTYIATDINDCKQSEDVTVEVLEEPVLILETTNLAPTAGETIDVTATSDQEIVSIMWRSGEGDEFTQGETTESFTFSETGMYVVEAKAEYLNTCGAREEILINVSEITPTDVKFTAGTETIIKVDQKLQLPVDVVPHNAVYELAYTITPESVATIDDFGVVTGLLQGQAQVMVTIKGTQISDIITITVEDKAPVSDLEFFSIIPSVGLEKTKQYTFEPEYIPATVTDIELIWSTSDEGIVSVENGTITALSVGTAKITAFSPATGITAQSTVTVEEAEIAPTALTMSQSILLPLNSSVQIPHIITPANATNKIINWTTSDATVATVNKSGAVFGLSEGSVTITAIIEGTQISATSTITVVSSNPPAQVYIPEHSATPSDVITIDLSKYITDDFTAVEDLIYSIKGDDNITYSFEKAVLTITAVEEFEGKEQLILIVEDEDGLSTEIPFTVSFINKADEAPGIIISDINLQDSNTETINLEDIVSDDFSQSDNLIWDISKSDNYSLEIEDNKLVINPTPGAELTDEVIEITATDENENTVTKQININGSKTTNTAPVIKAIPDQYTELMSYVPINLNKYVMDDFTQPSAIVWEANSTMKLKVQIINNALFAQITDKNWIGQETITITAYDESGLSSQTTINFNQLDANDEGWYGKPTVNFTANRLVTVPAKEVQLYADVSGATGIKWEVVDGMISDENISNPTVKFDKPGIYTVSLTAQNSQGETETKTEEGYITVAGITHQDTTICQGDQITVEVFGNGTYEWSTGETENQATITGEETATYWVTITDGIVSLEDSINITIPAVADLGEDKNICYATALPLNPGEFQTYNWTITVESEEPTVTANQKGKYAIEVVDVLGCISKDTMEIVEIYPLPSNEVTYDAVICKDSTTTITAQPGLAYQWGNGNTSQSIEVFEQGAYTLTVTDHNGCSSTNVLHLEVLMPYEEEIGVATYSEKGSEVVIGWEPTLGQRTAWYALLKEEEVGKYDTLQKFFPGDSTYYVDTEANVKVESHKYKLLTYDSTCYSYYESKPHITVHLTKSYDIIDDAINLEWNSYEGRPVSNYFVLRLRAGIWDTIGTVTPQANNQINRFTAIDYKKGDNYRIAFDLPEKIWPSELKTNSGPYSHSISNIAEIDIVSTEKSDITFSIYPIPVTNELSIVTDNISLNQIIIYTVDGIEIIKKSNGNLSSISVDELQSGVYIIEIRSDKGKGQKMFVKK